MVNQIGMREPASYQDLPSNKEGCVLQDGDVDYDVLVGLDDDDDDKRLTKASLGHWVD